jgi:hypothetical protein
MIDAKEARKQMQIAEAIWKCERFEERIKEAAAARSLFIQVPKDEMPPLGVEAFEQLGYSVEELTKKSDIPTESCLVHYDLIGYKIKWG